MRKTLHISMTERELSLGTMYLALELFILPLLLQRLNSLLPTALTPAQLNFCFFCLNFVCLLVFCHSFLWRSVKHTFRNFWRFLTGLLGGGMFYALSGFAVAAVIVTFFPDFQNVNDASVAAMYRAEPELMTLGTVFLVPFAEELLYRGVLFQGLHRRSRTAAYVVSVSVFCMIHVVSYLGQADLQTLLICLMQYIPPALVLAWIYERADSIYAPMLIHAVINALGIYAVR